METRTIELFENVEPLEVRAAEGNTPARLIGYAAVYNSLSADLGGFRERILPGAFRSSLNTGRDVRALVDHDASRLLGRSSNKTLRLEEDAKGLRIEIDVPEETTYGRDVLALVKRGDIRGMSFGFIVPKGGDRFTSENGKTIRELSNIDLREVTVTSIPAYGATSLSVRVDPSVITRAQAGEKSFEVEMANLRHRLSNVF